MNKSKLFLSAAAAGIVGAGVIASVNAQSDTEQAAKENAAAATAEKEKCYGVAKAGANDCGTAAHSCAGQATADAAGDEWVFLPKGICERLAGGSTQPKS